MNRRSFVALVIPAGLAAAAFAADPEPRLSGHVKEVLKDKNIIEIYTNKNRSVIRNVIYDGETQFMLDGKPSDVSAAQQGYRVVAVGAWEGKNLKAKSVTLQRR